jgi:hypothetical protein
VTLNLETFKKNVYRMNSQSLYDTLSKYPLEQILTEVFRVNADEKERVLLNAYEKLAVLCVTNFDKYKVVKYDYLKSIIKKVGDENLQEEFLRLFAKVIMQQESEAICLGLFTEMSDTWDLMYIEQGKYVVGLDYDNKSFLLQDRQDWEEILYMNEMQHKLRVGKISYQTYSKKMADKENKLLIICNDDVVRSRMLCLISQYITPKTIRILPKKWMYHQNIVFYGIREYKPTEYYIDKLNSKRYLLDRKGVTVKFENGCTFKEITFLETLDNNNQTVLLFRLTFPENGETIGFYDISSDVFLTAFSDYKEFSKENALIKNVVLEMYTELTCDFPKTDNPYGALLESENVDWDEEVSRSIFIHYSCEVFKVKEHDEDNLTRKRKAFTQRPHDRIHTTRDLPEGWKTSARARELAEQFNVELKDGETFVSPYKTGLHTIRKEIKRSGRPKLAK